MGERNPVDDRTPPVNTGVVHATAAITTPVTGKPASRAKARARVPEPDELVLEHDELADTGDDLPGQPSPHGLRGKHL